MAEMTETVQPKVAWQAIVRHVREVTIVGDANLDYWRTALAREDLSPLDCDGRAKVLISAPALRFMGVSFCEFSVSVAVECAHVEASSGEAVYLPHAFNSCSFFAWCERNMFATPYYPARITVRSSAPASVVVTRKHRPYDVLFRAEMSPRREDQQPESGAVGFEGPIFLPALGGGNRPGEKMFYGRITGETQSYPFLPGRDVLEYSEDDSTALGQLFDSEFAPRQWLMRQDATHAKSKTVPRR